MSQINHLDEGDEPCRNADGGSRVARIGMTLRLRFNLPQPGVSIIRAAPQFYFAVKASLRCLVVAVTLQGTQPEAVYKQRLQQIYYPQAYSDRNR